MGMWKKVIIICAALPSGALGQALPDLTCQGQSPDWSLDITQDTAQFDFQRKSDMTIPHTATAEGQDWPRALTLISRNDTAIVIIDQRQCDGDAFHAQVLTQRGETPVLLTGCCTATQ